MIVRPGHELCERALHRSSWSVVGQRRGGRVGPEPSAGPRPDRLTSGTGWCSTARCAERRALFGCAGRAQGRQVGLRGLGPSAPSKFVWPVSIVYGPPRRRSAGSCRWRRRPALRRQTGHRVPELLVVRDTARQRPVLNNDVAGSQEHVVMQPVERVDLRQKLQFGVRQLGQLSGGRRELVQQAAELGPGRSGFACASQGSAATIVAGSCGMPSEMSRANHSVAGNARCSPRTRCWRSVRSGRAARSSVAAIAVARRSLAASRRTPTQTRSAGFLRGPVRAVACASPETVRAS